MKQPRELLAWSDRELRSVEAATLTAWEGWLAAWGWPATPVEAASCECTGIQDEEGPAPAWETIAPSSTGVWVSGWPTVEAQLFARLCGLGSAGASPLAMQLIQRARLDLASRLAPAMNGVDVSQADPAADQYQPWSGGVLVRLARRGMQLRLLLAGDRVRSMVLPRPAAVAVAPLDHEGLEAAALASSAQATAELRPSLVDLGVLAQLAVGDVLRLDHALDHPIAIHLQGQQVCQAYLGRRGITKAVALAP